MGPNLDLPFGLTIPAWAVAGIGAALYAGWDRVREWLTRLLTHLVCVVTLDTDLGFFTTDVIYHRWGISRFGRKGILLRNVATRTGENRWVSQRWLPNSDTTSWVPCKWAPWIKLPLGITIKDGNVIFTYLRGAFDLEGLIDEVLERANAWKEGRFRVIRLTGRSGVMMGRGENGREQPRAYDGDSKKNFFVANYHGMELRGATYEQVAPVVPSGSVDDLYLEEAALQVVRDAETWFAAKHWYADRGLAWRRAVLCHGRPGTGKTSLARAIAIKLDLPVCLLDLGSMSNQDLEEAWETVRSNMPCMVLIEDIDGVYRGRESKLQRTMGEGPPTFDALLNRLDGADRNDGVFCVITSNNIDDIDTALGGNLSQDGTVLTGNNARPGRVDQVLGLPDAMPEAGKRLIAARLLGAGKMPNGWEAPMTPAQFQELCVAQSLADLHASA